VKQSPKFSIVQAADRLGITRQRLYQLVSTGKVPAEKVKVDELRIDGKALDALIAERAARQAGRRP
jgi:excisionase family DNA binding protein